MSKNFKQAEVFNLHSVSWLRCRLDDIAGDAELQEKSVADLKQLAERLVSECSACLRESAEKKEEENPEGKNYYLLIMVCVAQDAVSCHLSDIELVDIS